MLLTFPDSVSWLSSKNVKDSLSMKEEEWEVQKILKMTISRGSFVMVLIMLKIMACLVLSTVWWSPASLWEMWTLRAPATYCQDQRIWEKRQQGVSPLSASRSRSSLGSETVFHSEWVTEFFWKESWLRLCCCQLKIVNQTNREWTNICKNWRLQFALMPCCCLSKRYAEN